MTERVFTTTLKKNRSNTIRYVNQCLKVYVKTVSLHQGEIFLVVRTLVPDLSLGENG